MIRVPLARTDELYMRRCLRLASRGRGRTSPNPMVGAVLVRKGRVIAEAWHRRAGGDHAEVSVLSRAGAQARDATLYVNLEPCAHFGRTPPCVSAILEAGIGRVVVAHRDPHPLVRGRGLAHLRRAGVNVEVGVLRAQAVELNVAWLTRVTKGRPLVRIKAAMTLDGRIATATGESQWISSSASRVLAHRMRAAHDAVLVGANTAVNDDPRLSARRHRGAWPNQPLRVVLDSRLRLSPDARMLKGSTVVYTRVGASRRKANRLARSGVIVVRVGGRGTGRVPMSAVLADLASRGVASLLIEGGGEVIASALAGGFVDRVALFIAPMLMGGRDSIPVVGGKGAARIAAAVRLSRMTVRRVGPDFLIEGCVIARKGGH